MFKRNLKLLTLIISLLLNVTIVGQVTKTGTTAAKFLSIGIGPRAIAMGSAFTSVANDASAMYWNPAGIAQIKKYQAIFSYNKMFAGISLNYFGVVIPAGNIGVFGINVTALNVGQMEITTELQPDGTGQKFSANSYAFGLTYARHVTEMFIVGVNAKYIQENISNSNASGFAFDIGTIFITPFYGVRFSSSISNYGTKMHMTGRDMLVQHGLDPQRHGSNSSLNAYIATGRFELPLRLQVGLSRDFHFMKNQRFTLAVDANYPNDNSQWLNVGGELSLFNDLISIRGGYKTLFLKNSKEGLTFGFGIKYSEFRYLNFEFDYAYQKLKYLNNIQSIGILLNF